MRLVFAGTPTTALPSLDALIASDHDVVAVLTRPDAPAGRGRTLQPSPVAQRARDAGLEVLTPTRPGAPEALARLAELAPDVCPVVAYGALLPPAALAIPALGWINLHFSLLPSWRGAAPVQHALLAGDDVTGATTFLIEEGLDTGPVLGRMTERVRADDTAGSLLDRLARAGAGLLVATIDAMAGGEAVAVPQPGEGISLAPKLTTDDARVRWTEPAMAVDRRIRACTPAPGAWATLAGQRLKIGPVALVGPETIPAGPPLPPGQLVVSGSSVMVGTATQPVRLGTVQPGGKRPMPAADWARGARPAPDARFELDELDEVSP
ncbi:MAG: methionyl-tRNA formyltransferase [Austwickia sp.]|nr:methionyl-tRNA formyltransferase [Austwickia sp.]